MPSPLSNECLQWVRVIVPTRPVGARDIILGNLAPTGGEGKPGPALTMTPEGLHGRFCGLVDWAGPVGASCVWKGG